MLKKKIIKKFFKYGIKAWLKYNCEGIDITTLNLILNENFFGKVDEIYLKASNLIYQNLYINKIIIKIYNCNLKFNYRNHLIYSEDLIINSFLTIDNRNFKNIFFSLKWDALRKKIEEAFTEGNSVSNLVIKKDLIILSYYLNKFKEEIILSLNLKDNFIYLENITNKKKVFIPIDESIKFNSCNIKNQLININLSAKVTFDN